MLHQRRNFIFGKDQSLWSLPKYQQELHDNIKDKNHHIIFDHHISSWLFPFLADYSYYFSKGSMEFVATIFTKFQALLLSNTKCMNIDLKHKKLTTGENFHHFGVCIRVEEFENKLVDEVVFALNSFISHLTIFTYYQTFLQC